jgi:anti-sigma B factor antagonist
MAGEFDLATRDMLRDELHEAISVSPPPPRLLLGLSDVTFIDSTVIGVLIAVHKEVAALDGTLALADPQAHVRRLLALTQVDQVLPVLDSEPDTLATPALSATVTESPR